VILDADVSWKLAGELRRRGRRDATALRWESLDKLKDGALLKRLAAGFEPFTLVTWDNKMRIVHAQELGYFGSTVAVVSRPGMAGWAQSETSYVRDVVHRWLHRIEAQPAGTVAVYSRAGMARGSR